MLDMQDLQTALLVVSVVAALRKRVKALDGWWVVLATVVVAFVACAIDYSVMPAWARSWATITLYAVGGMSLVQQMLGMAKPQDKAGRGGAKEERSNAP